MNAWSVALIACVYFLAVGTEKGELKTAPSKLAALRVAIDIPRELSPGAKLKYSAWPIPALTGGARASCGGDRSGICAMTASLLPAFVGVASPSVAGAFAAALVALFVAAAFAAGIASL